MRRRHSRRHYRRFGAAEGEASAPAASSGKSMAFLTPKVGNVLIGVGALSALGAVGYYIYKGGEFGNLFSDLFGSKKEFAQSEAAAAAAKNYRAIYAANIARGVSPTTAARNAYAVSQTKYTKSLYE